MAAVTTEVAVATAAEVVAIITVGLAVIPSNPRRAARRLSSSHDGAARLGAGERAPGAAAAAGYLSGRVDAEAEEEEDEGGKRCWTQRRSSGGPAEKVVERRHHHRHHRTDGLLGQVPRQQAESTKPEATEAAEKETAQEVGSSQGCF